LAYSLKTIATNRIKMKKILLLFTLLITTISFSQDIKNINIYSDNGEKFTLFLNNIQQHEFSENSVIVTGLTSNAYGLKIIFENELTKPVSKTLYLPEESVEITYKIIEKKGKMKLRIVSQTTLPTIYEAVPNREVVMFTTTPIFVHTSTSTTIINNGGITNENVSIGINAGGVGMDVNINVNNNSNVQYTETTTISSTILGINEQYIMEGYNGPYGCPWPMNEMDFREALHTIKSKEWDDTKLKIAKQVISSNCLFSDQVRDVAQLFEWEENKLKFAKFAYQYTYDRGNYFKVSQVFEWEDNVEQLNEFISKQGY